MEQPQDTSEHVSGIYDWHLIKALFETLKRAKTILTSYISCDLMPYGNVSQFYFLRKYLKTINQNQSSCTSTLISGNVDDLTIHISHFFYWQQHAEQLDTTLPHILYSNSTYLISRKASARINITAFKTQAMAHFQIAVFHMNKAFQFVADLLILLPFIYTESLSVFGRQY